MFKKIYDSFIFQGNFKKKKYFEGWYYKFVSKDMLNSLVLIPGISLNKEHSHAFIQVFTTNSNNMSTYYFTFEINDFTYDYEKNILSIKDNLFSKDKVYINLKNNDFTINGEINFNSKENIIKKTLFSPSIMGPFSYIRFMECYHGVVSMNHKLKGNVFLNNKNINFDEGKGYIEKDWGKSFPKSYVWIQCNHFNIDNIYFMFSHADIPFMGFNFEGIICNLLIDKKEYRFATYNFSKIKKQEISSNKVYYKIKKANYILEISALNQETIDLKSPKNGMMIDSIKEGLSGEVYIKLFKNNKIIGEYKGLNAGLEIMK